MTPFFEIRTAPEGKICVIGQASGDTYECTSLEEATVLCDRLNDAFHSGMIYDWIYASGHVLDPETIKALSIKRYPLNDKSSGVIHSRLGYRACLRDMAEGKIPVSKEIINIVGQAVMDELQKNDIDDRFLYTNIKYEIGRSLQQADGLGMKMTKLLKGVLELPSINCLNSTPAEIQELDLLCYELRLQAMELTNIKVD